MADNPQDDDLLKDLMGNMESSPQKAAASPNTKLEKTSDSKVEVSLDETSTGGFFSKANLTRIAVQTRKKIKNSWPLPFMVIAIFAAAIVWLYLPHTIDEEDKIHEPEWWINRGMHYYKIAEDKGLETVYITGDFSRYEFDDISFEEQKKLYENMKQISGFHSNPNMKIPNQFLTTYVNDLNRLLLDEKLIEKIPETILQEIDEKVIDRLKDGLQKSGKASENLGSSAFVIQLKMLNRELLEDCFEGLPPNKPARMIAGKYFKYVFEKYPKSFHECSALELLCVADTFYFVHGESFTKKEKLKLYLDASYKNDPISEAELDTIGGGYGSRLIQSEQEKEGSLSLEDQAHLEYMIANLYFDLHDHVNAQKYFKRFLDLALEKSSEGFERRAEKSMDVYSSDKKSVLHREIKLSKINDAYFKLGNLQFINGETDEAKKNLEQFITKSSTSDPEKSFHANQILGDMYMSLKNYDKALFYFRKCLSVNAITYNQKNPVRYKTGLAYYRLGEYANAIERFKQVNGTGEYGRYDSAAIFYTGKSYLFLGDDENAIEVFKRIRDRFPQSDEEISATFEIAKYHYKKGLYDIAYSEPIDPKYSKNSKFDFSIKTLLEYPIDRFLKNEYLNVNEILVQPDSSSQEIGLLYDLANVFTAKKEYAKAIDVYTLMTSNPLAIHQMGAKRDKLYFDMAKIWAENGAPIRAGETLEIMLEKVPDSPYYSKALWDICKYYMSKSDYGRAIKPLRKFSNTYYGRPESPEADYLLGICEQKVGNFDHAIDSFNKAYGYIPWSPSALDKENPSGGTSQSDPYYELDRPENPIDRNFFAYQAIYQKGEAYRDVGQYDLAIEHIYKTVFNDPLFRFTPNSEIWKKSILVYADSYFYKGWQESKDIKLKNDFYTIANKSYKDYLERYKFTQLKGLSEEFESMQNKKWEESDLINFDIYHKLAYMKFDQKDYEKSREYYLKIIKWPMDRWTMSNRDEKKKEAFLMLPLTYYKEGKYSDAIVAFRDAKDRYAASSEAIGLGVKIAECLQNMGDYNNARLEYDASKWALELANANLFNNKPGSIGKQYWEELIKLKRNNLDWIQKNTANTNSSAE